MQLVKEICLHYVQKCAGQYSDNKAAARYVHQMAEEIIFQLGGVANEIKRTRGEPELYQALLDEWNEHFPASLGAIGSPKAIAQLVASQSKEIQRLKMELETEKINRENDVSGILRSMDAQLHTYRTSVMNDRKQQKNLYDHQLADRDDKAKKMKDSYELQIENIQDDHKCSMSALQKEYEELLKKCRDDHDKLANTFEMRLKDHKNKTQVKINKLRDKLILWEEKCMEIKGKYNELAAALSEDVISNSDLELPSDSDSDSEDSECEISNNMDIGEEFNVDVNETRRLVSERREKARNDAREKRPKREKPVRTPIPPTSNSDNSIAEKLKQLQESNLILSAQVKRMEKVRKFSDPNNKKIHYYSFVESVRSGCRKKCTTERNPSAHRQASRINGREKKSNQVIISSYFCSSFSYHYYSNIFIHIFVLQKNKSHGRVN